MKRYLYFLIFFIVLIGCDKTTTTQTKELVNLTFENELGEVYQVLENVEVGSTISLPNYTSETEIFVGWEIEEDIYYKEYLVESAQTFSVVLENPTEVFDYVIEDNDLNAIIFDYTGDAKYLTIPEQIEGKIVYSLASNAFSEKDLIEIKIPNTVQWIGQLTFSYLPNLEKVSFYGDYRGYVEQSISNEKYLQIITENSDVCVLVEGTENKGKYLEGCPISEVINKSDPVIINEIEFINYRVIFDLRYYHEFQYNLSLNQLSFYELPELETIEFNSRIQYFHPGFLENTPKIKNLKFENNPYFEVVYGVVYNEDLSSLIYYPANRSGEEYTVLENTQIIDYSAFFENQNLKILNIPRSIETIQEDSFYKMEKIEAINIDDGDYSYTSDDGIVYEESAYGLSLFYFPANKQLTMFQLADNIQYLSDLAFNNNKNLVQLILNEGLISIGPMAFAFSQKIELLNIPTSVDSIGHGILYRSNVETMIINRSFYVDGSITRIFNLTVYSETPEIYLPDDSIDIYLEDMFWSNIEEFVKPLSEYEPL